MWFYESFAFIGFFFFIQSFISTSVKRAKRSVIVPIVVVKIPVFFDFVQPEREINVVSANKPIRNVIIPIVRGIKKSSSVIFFKYPPGVVTIDIFVMAKIDTKKQPAEIVAVFNKRLFNLLFRSETIRFATIAIENPLNRELIKIS